MKSTKKKIQTSVKDTVVKEAKAKLADIEKLQAKAEIEMKKLEKEMEKTAKQVREYIKKNPEKAAAVSAGVGAAVGAALAFLVKGVSKK